MAQIALAAFVAYFLVACGWRSWLQYRRTGDTGFRLLSRRSGVAEWVSWPLAILGGLMAAATLLLALSEVIRPAAFRPVQVLGFIVIALGFVLTVIAQLHLGESWRIGVDTREVTPLVTNGVFRHVRNPIFTGVLMVLLGMVFLLPHALSVLGFILVAVALEVHVRWVEEPYLLWMHGDSYRQYLRSVGRFCPKIGYLHRS